MVDEEPRQVAELEALLLELIAEEWDEYAREPHQIQAPADCFDEGGRIRIVCICGRRAAAPVGTTECPRCGLVYQVEKFGKVYIDANAAARNAAAN